MCNNYTKWSRAGKPAKQCFEVEGDMTAEDLQGRVKELERLDSSQA